MKKLKKITFGFALRENPLSSLTPELPQVEDWDQESEIVYVLFM